MRKEENDEDINNSDWNVNAPPNKAIFSLKLLIRHGETLTLGDTKGVHVLQEMSQKSLKMKS